MNILHIITSTDKGGAESHLLSLASGQIRLHGDNVCVVVLSPGPDELDAAFAEAGVEVLHIPLDSKFFPFPCILGLKNIIRARKPDIVHTHLLPANIIGGAAARLCRVPHVASKHNDEKQLASSFFWRAIHALASWLCDDGIICLSSYVAEYMQGHGLNGDMMHVVPYAFDPALYSRSDHDARKEFGISADTFLVGIIARLTPQKGHTYLLEAFARFLQDAPQARLLVVGREDAATTTPQEVRELAARLHLENAVDFTGQRNDAYDIMAALDVLMLPSLWEGFGLVLLEAASLEIPVIASRVSAIPEVLGEDGGLLVPPADVGALYNAMRMMHKEYGLWKEKAVQRKRRILETFSLEKMVAGTRKVYEGLV